MNMFLSADILLPEITAWEKWAVVACDQFTSQPEYWQRVSAYVGETPSALHLIYPEAELKQEPEAHIRAIRASMADYEARGLFRSFPESFIYVERRLLDGTLRRGLVGRVDLEQYDFSPQTDAPVRATEKTVVERIPPRVRIREGAPLELPHVLLLCDDEEDAILGPLSSASGETLYDFELMEGGGRIRGTLLSGAQAAAVVERLEQYEETVRARYADLTDRPMLYAVGDGNHSLATAKTCYERLKEKLGPEASARHPARWALTELGSLHDSSLRFAPIHRLVTETDIQKLLDAAETELGDAEGTAIPWFSGDESGVLRLPLAPGQLAVGVLQGFLDRYLAEHPGEIDYIHGDETLRELAGRPGSLGFLLPEIRKDAFFRGIMTDGVLPRKTFSMGQAQDKRYYIEARRIG